LGCHLRNRLVMRRPDAVVHHQAIEAPKDSGARCDQCRTILYGGQFLLNGAAEVLATTLGYQRICLGLRCTIAEDHACSCTVQQPHGCGTDPAGAPCYKRHLARQRQRYAIRTTMFTHRLKLRVLPITRNSALFRRLLLNKETSP
jgi:hypothetical protein